MGKIGCSLVLRPKNDFIYEDQISNFVEEKILNNLDTAFSRDQIKKFMYRIKFMKEVMNFSNG